MSKVGEKMKEIKLKGEYITLGQLLKLNGIVYSGGETKEFLLNNQIMVNDELENRRGRKLYINDVIKVNNLIFKIV